MAGPFWRKVASAFVELPDPPKPAPEIPDVSADLDELLASVPDVPEAPEPTPATRPAPAAPPTAGAALGSASAVFERAAEQIYASAAITDTPSSAHRILKMLAGLAAFPRPQQLAMLRALDAADETWTEELVITDARGRQAALRNHLQAIEQARAARLSELEQATRDTQARRQQMLADIDKQIAELTLLREQAMTETAQNLAELESKKQECEVSADAARGKISGTVNELSELVSFLTGAGPLPR